MQTCSRLQCWYRRTHTVADLWSAYDMGWVLAEVYPGEWAEGAKAPLPEQVWGLGGDKAPQRVEKHIFCHVIFFEKNASPPQKKM